MKPSQPIRRERDKTAASSWLPKLSRALLLAIMFLAPTQLGYHFWPDSALIYGVRVDYLSPTLYFLDLLILVYLFLQKFRPAPILYSLFFILISNFIFSINPLSTLSWSLHTLLYLAFFTSFSWAINHKLLTISITAASLFQLALSVTQVWLGHSLQGPLYYLGERMVSVGQPGVALAAFMNEVVLRAYGTFGHPNILAGWLVIVSLIVLNLKPTPLIRYSSFVIPGFGIILTQSRSAALAFFGIVIPIYLLKTLRSRLIYYLIVVLFVIQYSLFTPPRSDLSLSERLSLQSISLKTIQSYPVFGTGAQASISSYPQVSPQTRLLQPDHNSFTLFVSWFGIIVTTVLIVVIYKLYNFKLLTLVPIFPLLFLDHYLLTSPQGLFILIIYLRVTMNHKL